jgi:hypothetical protein
MFLAKEKYSLVNKILQKLVRFLIYRGLMAQGIFLIDKSGELREMEPSKYESEADLQQIIAKFPRLLSSHSGEINSSSWILIKREIGVPQQEGGIGRWSLDHLFIDSNGLPILVEVKRSTDTRIRREVVGQLLDYAANAVAYWPIEYIQNSFAQECESQGKNPEESLNEFLGEAITVENFWLTVKTNLNAGRVRLLFVADSIPDELRRIIEFLNSQMEPAEVLGIEVKHFTDGKLRSVIPNVVGETMTAKIRKRMSSSGSSAGPSAELEEAVQIFNNKKYLNLIAVGAGWGYRQVRIPEFPPKLHYEFISRVRDGITAEFHIESDKYRSISKTLQEFVKNKSTINGGEIIFDPDWSKGNGRIRIIHPNNSPSIAAETMVALIEETKGVIFNAIKNLA